MPSASTVPLSMACSMRVKPSRGKRLPRGAQPHSTPRVPRLNSSRRQRWYSGVSPLASSIRAAVATAAPSSGAMKTWRTPRAPARATVRLTYLHRMQGHTGDRRCDGVRRATGCVTVCEILCILVRACARALIDRIARPAWAIGVRPAAAAQAAARVTPTHVHADERWPARVRDGRAGVGVAPASLRGGERLSGGSVGVLGERRRESPQPSE